MPATAQIQPAARERDPTFALRIRVHGVVQGIGFRPWVQRTAAALGLVGSVRNAGTGVTIDAFGTDERLRALLARVAAPDLPSASVTALEHEPLDASPPDSFSIAESEASGARDLCLAPDVATCPDCLAELFRPGDRRYRYPFTTCTQCGPRLSIADALPYDRARSSMSAFQMCAECVREYGDATDRRFHAQANACPRCGPRLTLLTRDGRALADGDEALCDALDVLARGGIAAVQGVGGFHLACAARSEAAVRELRARKQRDRKPFAVMVRDLDAAQELAELCAEERVLLCSQERPIVLLRRRPEAGLAASVAPGSNRVGLLLPYTPLHHLLLHGVADPLVMTSGNRSGDPIAYRAADAFRRLRDVADAFLVHDRAITAPCDDSVGALIAGAPTLLRRSRGFVPRPIRLRRPVREPVLACGGQLNNAFCIAVEDRAYLSAHNGDLDAPEAYDAFERGIEHMQQLLGVRPDVIAHDLHPLYESSRYAQKRGAHHTVGVQHHHAHIASAMAEHGLEGSVVGISYDGTGYGPDGAAWGGELLRADLSDFERLARFRAIPLAGGDVAIRQVWRIALALLEDAFDGDPPLAQLPVFAQVPAEDLRVVRRMLRAGVRCAPAHGVGRYFDAIGSLVLMRPQSDFQGEIAMAWEGVARAGAAEPYPYVVADESGCLELDLRPMVRQVVRDHLGGRSAGEIASRFHETVAAATAALVHEFGAAELPVVLSGGCFQNDLLTSSVLRQLEGRRVYRHRDLPPGDGGIGLGQVLVADARVAEDSPCA